MKKTIALLLALCMIFALAACGKSTETENKTEKSEGVKTYAEYAAAELEAPVVVETYVQAHQSWWDGKVTVYTQDQDGAYFIYNMTCSEEDAAKLVPGQKIKVTGFKGRTVEAYDESGAAFASKDPEGKSDDLYFKVSKDGQTYDFCVEFYLCGKDTAVYQAVENLKVGDTVDLEGFLYWYNGANPHITAVTVK